MSGAPKIVVLGMMSKMPVAGVVWQTVHYLVGFERLGYDAYYVEAHARTPSMFMEHEDDDGSGKAAAFIDRVMRRFDLGGRWAFHALHDDGRCYGMSDTRLRDLYRAADLLINLHGGTAPLPEHAEPGRLVYLETDPAALQVELHESWQRTIDFLEPHCAFFTFAENWGNEDCRLPITDRFNFHPTRQPVVLDLWSQGARGAGETFTTIGSWKQHWRDIVFAGETYSWSKHHEFLKFLDLPERTGQTFELALGGCDAAERAQLESCGWRVRDAVDLSGDIDLYRDYVQTSRAEFTVAKDQNVRLRTGWFSDRSATYLAAGRPVVTQETGFSNVVPTGEGLFAFSSSDEAVAAVEGINADYARHSRSASAIARDYFDADKVLIRLLDHAGVERRGQPGARGRSRLLSDLVLEPVKRRPLVLPAESVDAVRELEPASPSALREPLKPDASVVVVTYGGLAPTKLCLESVLRNTEAPSFEVIVVDNGSDPEAKLYLGRLASEHPHVRAIFNAANAGFPPACNRGVAAAQGDVLVVLNNDTVVPPGWLARLVRPLAAPEIGLVGPVTNRIGNEAEIRASYRTYGEFLEFAARRARDHEGALFDIGTATMFCLAMRRDMFERIGPFDERYEVGLLEDDDYSLRVREAGYRVACAEDVFVHHFGEASFGALVGTGEYNEILSANKRKFAEKWGRPWEPYERGEEAAYEELLERVRDTVRRAVPERASVLVVSRGDERLLELDGRVAGHFPQTEHGVYAGYYPSDGHDAIAHLEALRVKGAEFLVFPETSFWWLDHYGEFRDHLEQRYGAPVVRDEGCVVFALEERKAQPRSQSSPRCSIVVPVFNRVPLTSSCLNVLLSERRRAETEIIVVDDGSTDETAAVLAGYHDRIRVVRRSDNGGFAAACNDGAAVATGEYLVFLNNDTLPQEGWLDALVTHAERHPRAAVVGSKLLFPDGSVQHAGVVICHDGHPRHLYAGFPGDHPAVSRSRRFKAVTFASALVRRGAFADAGGFDAAFHNGLEDVDLCLRLADRGWEVEFCHESVVEHLETASRHRSAPEVQRNHRLFRQRWASRVAPDDFKYYIEDGLLSVGYADVFPIRLSASPLLAILAEEGDDNELARVLQQRASQVAGLLHETSRLTVALAEQAGLAIDRRELTDGAGSSLEAESRGSPRGRLVSDSPELLAADREIERLLHSLQTALADRAAKAGRGLVPPADYLGYEAVIRGVQSAVEETVPPRAAVAVISRGDDELVRLRDRSGMHLPQTERGTYAGYHPADSAEAVRHLEDAQARGADFLVVPSASFWWLEHYREFAEALDRDHECVHRGEACAIYRLAERRVAKAI